MNKKKRKIVSARARWDGDSNPANPGWVVDVELADGTKLTVPACPDVYYAAKDANTRAIVSATLEWEGWRLSKQKGAQCP